MNKKAVIIFLILMLTSGAFAKEKIDELHHLYEAQEYEKAYYLSHEILKEDMSNPEVHYYLGLCYLEVGQKEYAKIEFNNVIAISPNSQYAYLSKIYKKKFFENKTNVANSSTMLNSYKSKRKAYKRNKKTKVLSKPRFVLDDSDNYFYSALSDGRLIRFNADYPIYIYIPFEDYGYETRIHEAFALWEDAYKKFDFRYTLDKKKADIVFIFENEVAGKDSFTIWKGEKVYYSGLTIPILSGNFIKRVDIKIKTKTYRNHRRPSFRVFDVILHEVGHALGIWDHSDNYKDIMFFGEDYDARKARLTERDKNTIRLIYENEPDITNKK